MQDLNALVIDVRASTSGFAADVAQMRGSFDSILVDGFVRSGDVLEKGLLGAIRRGSLGFEDLRKVALGVVGDIASQAVRAGIGSLGLGGGGGGLAGGAVQGLGSLIGSIFGLPGRATGGPVAPGRGYLVGERGPELFVPTSSGSIAANGAGAGGSRDVNVSIRVVAPAGSGAPESLQRSSRQVAQAVRRALADY
ncbi:tail tape measure protein [Novosphingobium lentum]|uniref:tail tape measure protein n=1 Tax=Novosphingobium lentum TaxID=145287 RepID=UPI00082FA003|nr:tail tape measure protein [Novosphingobium lentum]